MSGCQGLESGDWNAGRRWVYLSKDSMKESIVCVLTDGGHTTPRMVLNCI